MSTSKTSTPQHRRGRAFHVRAQRGQCQVNTDRRGSMIEFLKQLTLAVVPLVVEHALEVRRERVKAATPDTSTSFAAYVARQS
jgi:hypothetical protein